MKSIEVLKLMDKSVKDSKSSCISDRMTHPVKSWPLEERLVYLHGLVLVFLAEDSKSIEINNYLNSMVYEFSLDDEQEILEEMLKNCNEEAISSLVDAFRNTLKCQIFIYDAIRICRVNNALHNNGMVVVCRLAELLGISEATWDAINEFYNQIQKEDWYESVITLSSPLIEPSMFRHLFWKVGLDNYLLGKRVEVPSGSFVMGSDDKKSNEYPAHSVNINKFYMQEAAVSFSQWRLFVRATGYASQDLLHIWMRVDYDGVENLRESLNKPVSEISYLDVTKYFIPWINRLTGRNYRLPSEAEWEYAARANSNTEFFSGEDISESDANYDKHHDFIETVPVKSYKPNVFGLYGMYGNVWEWTDDCWGDDGYYDAPDDGSAWYEGDCGKRIVRGGSWCSYEDKLRSTYRECRDINSREKDVGFRLVVSG